MDRLINFNGKRVVIVGPASSILKNDNGDFIDNFDIIVRVNRGIEPIENFSKSIGSRTDILYNCLLEHPDNGGLIDVDFLKKNNVKCVVYHPEVSFGGLATSNKPPHGHNALLKLENAKMPSFMIDYIFYNSISSQVNCRPNTGYIALHHLLSFNIKELYITGFTFYMDEFMDGYKDHVDKNAFREKCFISKRHNQENLFNHLKLCVKNDKRIKCDKYLDKILQLEKLDKTKSNLIFND
jgi:hypothetical protein